MAFTRALYHGFNTGSIRAQSFTCITFHNEMHRWSDRVLPRGSLGHVYVKLCDRSIGAKTVSGKRCVYCVTLCDSCITANSGDGFWMKARSSEWWERIVLAGFTSSVNPLPMLSPNLHVTGHGLSACRNIHASVNSKLMMTIFTTFCSCKELPTIEATTYFHCTSCIGLYNNLATSNACSSCDDKNKMIIIIINIIIIQYIWCCS